MKLRTQTSATQSKHPLITSSRSNQNNASSNDNKSEVSSDHTSDYVDEAKQSQYHMNVLGTPKTARHPKPSPSPTAAEIKQPIHPYLLE